MTKNYYKKNNEKIRKEAREKYQNLPEEEKKRSINMVVKDIRIFWRMIIENIFLEFRKRDSLVKKIFYYIYPMLVHRLKNVLEYKKFF